MNPMNDRCNHMKPIKSSPYWQCLSFCYQSYHFVTKIPNTMDAHLDNPSEVLLNAADVLQLIFIYLF
jgi:hypothetical protein